MSAGKFDEIKRNITDLDLRWKADKEQYLEFSRKKPSNLLGFTPAHGKKSLKEREINARQKFDKLRELPSLGLADTTPSSFDLRNVQGRNYVTSVKNQGFCGSCVAFGIAAAAEGTLRRQEENLNLDVDYSEAHLFYCHGQEKGRDCNNGWWPEEGLDAFKNQGVVDETCFAYSAGDQACNLCGDADNHLNKITNWNNLTSAAEMKEWIVNKGPLVACLTVYQDLFAYTSGVYQTTNSPDNPILELGGHCVCCVGYDDASQCWICKNSWGNWGDSGYFRIAYGDCGIDDSMQGIEGVWSTTSLSQVFSSRGFRRPMNVRIIAEELGLSRPFLISQIIEKLL